MAVLGADTDELRRLATTFHASGGRLQGAERALSAAVRATSWSGPDADRFRGAWPQQAGTLRSVADRLASIAKELDVQVTQQINASAGDGMITIPSPFGASAVIDLPVVLTAGDIPTTVDSGDRREDRRVENDRRARREPGGAGSRSRDRGGDLDNDWAGRSILDRYLSGGDDWTISNDPQWNEYMMAHPGMRDELATRADSVAIQLYDQFVDGGSSRTDFDDTFHLDLENGEGIVGYQYLHGTNADVGDFHMAGGADITRTPDGGYDVRLSSDDTWNDVIDPNGQYRTDQVKSTIAEILTLGQADPYDIHITWSSDTVIHLDAAGNIVSTSGYPGG